MSDVPEPRYAVYYVPPKSAALWTLAQQWLGRDCESGQPVRQPLLGGWSAKEIAEATQSPAHYGFHATLKAPFRLVAGKSLRDLQESLAAFAAGQAAFAAPPLKVSTLGAFIALTFTAASPEMTSLAAAAVRDLDPLRAPLSESDLQHRLAGGLTPRQEALLRAWGYPYVFEEFRFHMTLTGPIGRPDRRQRLQACLAAHFQPVLAGPVPVGEICLYSQDASEAPFLLTRRFNLGVSLGAKAKTEQGQAVP